MLIIVLFLNNTKIVAIMKGENTMKITGAKTIAEYKKMQKEHIQKWIDYNFVEGAVKWEMDGALHIKVTDRTGDSMVVALDDII